MPEHVKNQGAVIFRCYTLNILLLLECPTGYQNTVDLLKTLNALIC